MLRALSLAAAAAAAAAAPSKSDLLWYHNEPTEIYDSAAVARQSSGGPTFAVAVNNGGTYVDVFNSAVPNGSHVFRFNPTTAPGGTLYVDMARHASAVSAPAIDTFVLSVPGNGSCVLYGLYSAGPQATGTPAWTVVFPSCAAGEGIGGAYQCLQASDDGSLVAVLGTGVDAKSGNATVSAYGVDGLTGTLLWQYDLGLKEKAGQGDIAVTPTGAYVAFVNEDSDPCPNCAQLHVIEGKSGKLRAEVQMPFFIAAAVSDSGSHVVIQNFTHLVGSEGWVLTWNGTGYSLSHRLNPPDTGVEFDVWDIATSTLADGTEVAALGWISAPDVRHLRVNAWNLATGAMLTDWLAPVSATYQNNPTIRMDGGYMSLALWGNADDTPTAVLLKAGSNSSTFSYVTPGSMFAVDVVVDTAASSPSTDVVYLATAGKHVPANVMGAGGDAYAWKVSVPK